ncbi:hypothetical protein [Bacillus sp. EB01]|uniref:hypothetical protein n=1 Tax=Bacillus sp. EB01 TaxID=1347086 RepID=UPI0005C6DB5B|nr:hypothetical protein [Bacillus sp. EB01]
MRVLLELLRIIVLFVIIGGILGSILDNVYSAIGTDIKKYGWIGFIAIIILFFILYRNKLQFGGWYKGKGREKLPKNVFQILIFSGILLLLLPPILSFF